MALMPIPLFEPLTLPRGVLSVAVPGFLALKTRPTEGLRVLVPKVLRHHGRHGRIPAMRVPAGFQIMCGRRLEASEPLTEPRLAELPPNGRSLHPNAPLCVLEDQAVAVRSEHDSNPTASVVHVLPARWFGSSNNGGERLSSPASEAFDSLLRLIVSCSLRQVISLSCP
jgi:hypothetical protein